LLNNSSYNNVQLKETGFFGFLAIFILLNRTLAEEFGSKLCLL